MRCRAWITLVVTTALLLSSPGASADPFTTLPPAWVAVEVGEGGNMISWGAPADGGAEVQHYVVYRGDEPVAHVTGFSYLDTTVGGGVYSVAAVGPAGESVAVVGVLTWSPDCIAWVPGFPPIVIDIWECIDLDDADAVVRMFAGGQPPRIIAETPLDP